MLHGENEVVIPPAQIDEWLVLVNVVEHLSDVSGGLLAAANEGVPYETLVRGLRVLHLQHLKLAARAERAKQCQLPVLEMQEKSSETSPKHDTSTAISCVKVGVA